MKPALLIVALALSACAQDGLDAPSSAVDLDRPYFRCNVQPILVRDCGFFRCHGSGRRPFRVYAPNALRDDLPRDRRAQPLTAAEEDANYAAALAFAGTDGNAALLLLKPLDERAGGYYHRSATYYDRGDVFTTAEDPGYTTIAAWIGGATAPGDCTPMETP